VKQEVRALLEDAARRYIEAKPWEKLRDEHYFQVVDEETGLDAWASVAGNVGEEFGLGLYMGTDGRKVIEKTLSLDLDVEKQSEAADVIALTVADAQEAENFRPGTMLDSKIEVAGKPSFPIVFRKPPGEGTRVLRDKEGTFLARVLLAVARTKEWGLDEDDVLDEVGGRLILRISGPTSDPKIDRAYDEPPAAGVVVLPAPLEQRLHEAKRTKRLLVRFADRTLTVYDPKEKKVWFEGSVPSDDSVAAGTLLLDALAGDPKKGGLLPREIWTDTPSLETALAPALDTLGVKIQVKLELKDLRTGRGG
jgi:hypothetical protein